MPAREPVDIGGVEYPGRGVKQQRRSRHCVCAINTADSNAVAGQTVDSPEPTGSVASRDGATRDWFSAASCDGYDHIRLRNRCVCWRRWGRRWRMGWSCRRHWRHGPRLRRLPMSPPQGMMKVAWVWAGITRVPGRWRVDRFGRRRWRWAGCWRSRRRWCGRRHWRWCGCWRGCWRGRRQR